jgi:capsid protein
MLHDFEDAAAVACSNSAKRLGFFVSPSGDAPPGFADQIVSSVLDAAHAAGKVLTPDEIQQITASAEKYTTTVPGTFDTVPSGYDFRQYDSPWPNIDSTEYVKSQVRGWSAAQGASYVSIGNDLADVNYSSARVGILDEREHYKELQSRLISWLHEDVFETVLPYLAAATPGLQVSRLPDYLAAATWQARRWQGIDPVKESQADETNLQNGLTSRSRIIMARGEDPDEIAAERAADVALFGPLPTASAAAPDAGAPDPDGDAADDSVADKRPRRNFLPISKLRPV